MDLADYTYRSDDDNDHHDTIDHQCPNRDVSGDLYHAGPLSFVRGQATLLRQAEGPAGHRASIIRSGRRRSICTSNQNLNARLSTGSPAAIETPATSECPICFMEPVPPLGTSVACHHVFCALCIVQWLHANAERGFHSAGCPLCRTEMDKILVGSQSHSKIDKYYDTLEFQALSAQSIDEVIVHNTLYVVAAQIHASKSGEESEEEVFMCGVCHVADDLEMMCCDQCDHAFHLACVNLSRSTSTELQFCIPSGMWFCETCWGDDDGESLLHLRLGLLTTEESRNSLKSRWRADRQEYIDLMANVPSAVTDTTPDTPNIANDEDHDQFFDDLFGPDEHSCGSLDDGVPVSPTEPQETPFDSHETTPINHYRERPSSIGTITSVLNTLFPTDEWSQENVPVQEYHSHTSRKRQCSFERAGSDRVGRNKELRTINSQLQAKVVGVTTPTGDEFGICSGWKNSGHSDDAMCLSMDLIADRLDEKRKKHQR